MDSTTQTHLGNAKILLVDDDQLILEVIQLCLEESGCQISTAQNGKEALQLLAEKSIDIIISDMEMPEMNGEELLREVAKLYPTIIRMLLTASGDLQRILRASNQGHIWGFLQKPVNTNQLLLQLTQALNVQQGIRERSLYRYTLDHYQRGQKKNFEGFIGASMPMQFVYSAIENAAPSEASVFITGPNGSGKELVAQAIHNLSRRKDQKCVVLNCAAIPKELLESEIFGHTKGAFTGAQNQREGAAAKADGGTLFFDELGEMDILLQAKLLRFIQTGYYQPVGSDKPVHADIRFICATNRDPQEAITQHKLREDLYYRLNVISIHLPPLNERGDDVLLLAHHFMTIYSEQENKNFIGITAAAEQLLLNYSWPGNVRQLNNCIHYCVVMSDGPLLIPDAINAALQLSVSHLLSAQEPTAHHAISNSVLPVCNLPASIAEIRPLVDIERDAIKAALLAYDNNMVAAATALEVSPSTLYRKTSLWPK